MVEEIRIYSDGPFYDGVTRYKGDYIELELFNKPNESIRDVDVRISDKNVVWGEKTNTKYGSNVTLNFLKAGTATITLTSGDKAVSQSYTITVKDDYDFNPGKRQLTPEEFADYTTKVMCANGFTYSTGATSWRLMTLSADELTFARAVAVANACCHEWWSNGKRYCQIVYIGQNENGGYQFHTCWG